MDLEGQNLDGHDGKFNYKSEVQKIKSAGAVTISSELFEKLVQPQDPGDKAFRKTFANPTPLAFQGLFISTATFAMVLMGWGGATTMNSVVGIFFFTGPVLLTLGTIFNWIIGDFLSMMICGLFAVFWLSFGGLNLPEWQIAASYSASGTNVAEGSLNVGYNAGIALFLTVWGFAFFTFFIFTFKTSMVFVLIFFFVDLGAWLLTAAYWKVASGDLEYAMKLQRAGGAMLFVVALLGWYMTVVMMSAELGITTKLPVGDLSHLWPSSPDVAEAERRKQN